MWLCASPKTTPKTEEKHYLESLGGLFFFLQEYKREKLRIRAQIIDFCGNIEQNSSFYAVKGTVHPITFDLQYAWNIS